MTGSNTVAGRLLDQLGAAGCDVVFGLPGVHNLAFWDAQGPGRPRIVGVRHEQAAVYAADGLARATGRVQAALTTSGPGAANAVGAFGEAVASRSPVLLISSEPPMRSARRSGEDTGLLHSMPNQAAMFSTPFDAFTLRLPSSVEASHLLPTVLRILDSIPAPGYLGIPADVLAMTADEHDPQLTDFYERRPDLAPSVPEPADVERLAELLEGKRVVIWAGPEVIHAGAEALLTDVATRLGAPVIATYGARGLMAGHRLLVDAPPHEPEIAELIASADLMLVVGDDLQGMSTRNWTMPIPAVIAAITRYAGTSLGDYDIAVRLECEVATTLTMLLAAMVPITADPWLTRDVAADVRVRLRNDPRGRAGMAFVDAVARGWPMDSPVIADMCVAGYWTGGYLPAVRPRRMQYPVGWGTLGYGLPAAIGTAAAGIPTLAVVGDGGAAMSVGELATFVQECLPITLVLVDDGGYGMLRFDQQAFGHPERGVDLLGPNWLELAAAFGLGAEAADISQLDAALARAHQANVAGTPRMIVVTATLHPPRTTSPRWHEGV